MIINESYKLNEKDFIKTYSNLSVYIRKIKLGGNEELYSEARYQAELSSFFRKYEETDIPIEDETDPETDSETDSGTDSLI